MGVSLDVTAKDTGFRGTQPEVKSQSCQSLAPKPQAHHVFFLWEVETTVVPCLPGLQRDKA